MCDDTVCATYMWRDYLGTEMCVDQGTLFLRVPEGAGYLYTVPLGKDLRAALQAIMKLPHQKNSVGFYPVLSEELGLYAELFRNTEIVAKQDWYDYIYLCENLAKLSGKKYHTQKNHVNQFLASYPDWELVSLTQDRIADVVRFEEKYISGLADARPMELEENYRTLEVLKNFDRFDLTGFVLYANQEVIAYELGEVLRDTFYAHIEKADRTIRGAYTMIVHEVAKTLLSRGLSYINREEDVGDPGLRYSKRQYRPVKLAIKHRVYVKEEETWQNEDR
ncbi:MAG: phosphatidylglycerol lysyltransferase domain-containing protein [Clostridiales bacterium]|nr:phosphatidylglycerol lysyltransferase domain-containing protein [Clostridiales bacterium]